MVLVWKCKLIQSAIDVTACRHVHGSQVDRYKYLRDMNNNSQLLAIPRHNLSFGSRSFRVPAPRIWNSLTPQIRQCQTLANSDVT